MTNHEQDRIDRLSLRLDAWHAEQAGELKYLREIADDTKTALHRLDSNLTLAREEVINVKAELSARPCITHERKISDLYRAVGEAETTDRVEQAKLEAERAARARLVDEADRRWKRIATIVGIASGAAGLGVFKLFSLMGCG